MQINVAALKTFKIKQFFFFCKKFSKTYKKIELKNYENYPAVHFNHQDEQQQKNEESLNVLLACSKNNIDAL